MKKLGLLSILAFALTFLAGCANKTVEPEEIVDEGNMVEIVEDQEDIKEEIVEEKVEEKVEEEVIDGEKWNLLAFNGKEVDGDYNMTITNDGKLYTKFCNGMGGDVNFDGDEDGGTISASLFGTKMFCEGESMDLENAFDIDGASYITIANEDGGKTTIITTLNGDKFMWRTNSL